MLTVLFLIFHLKNVMVHPIHISVSEVEITTHEIKWTARIYRDDLLLALYGKNVELSQIEDEEKVRKDILSYISKNVSVSIQNVKVKWVLTDIQPDPEAIWIYLTSALPSGSNSSITVRNRILLDIYRDQKNVTNFQWPAGKKNVVFDSGCEEKVISF